MHAALDQGEIPRKIKAIPKRRFNRELKLLFVLINPTENIITGMLNNITITLLIEKFILFNKFIEAEIDPKQDKINDPIIKLKNKIIMSLKGRLNKRPATGIEIKNGTCTKIKCENIFKKAINS